MVYLFLADGFEEIEALTPLDLFRRAKIDICTVGVSQKTVVGSHDIPVLCDKTIDEISLDGDFEMLILPGGMPGATNLDSCEKLSKLLEIAVKKEKKISAICASPFLLGKRGYLQGKKATCYPSFEKYLLGATYQNEGVIWDGNVITARAMGSATDFALTMIESLRGKEVKDEMAKAILYKEGK